MGIGQLLIGLFIPVLLVLSLPEMIDIIDLQYSDLNEQQKSQAYDFSSGLFNTFLGLGQFFGPMYGSIATQLFGFRTCLDYVAFASLAIAILYLTFTEKTSKMRRRWFLINN